MCEAVDQHFAWYTNANPLCSPIHIKYMLKSYKSYTKFDFVVLSQRKYLKLKRYAPSFGEVKNSVYTSHRITIKMLKIEYFSTILFFNDLKLCKTYIFITIIFFKRMNVLHLYIIIWRYIFLCTRVIFRFTRVIQMLQSATLRMVPDQTSYLIGNSRL